VVRADTQDDIVRETFTDYNAKEAANKARIEAVERAQKRDWFTRMYPGRPIPKELQDGGDAA